VLQHLIGLRLDLRLPRTTLSAVHAASGGNPMFALEFGRVAKEEDARLRPRLPMPASLQELVGAQPWLERAEDELRRANPRPRHDGELTNAERRVAALVVQGQTNKEVAARLFTTTATVEAHLTRIYRKLGVRSRTELARAATDGALTLE
jgi:DNA-binding NarL/FixJ family response regulator